MVEGVPKCGTRCPEQDMGQVVPVSNGFGTTTETFSLFVCVEALRPCQQLRSCRAGQLPINTVPGQT